MDYICLTVSSLYIGMKHQILFYTWFIIIHKDCHKRTSPNDHEGKKFPITSLQVIFGCLLCQGNTHNKTKYSDFKQLGHEYLCMLYHRYWQKLIISILLAIDQIFGSPNTKKDIKTKILPPYTCMRVLVIGHDGSD